MKPLILSFSLLICSVISAQTIGELALQKLDSFTTAYPQEKVYVHTDRSQFAAGETIWFAAYVMAENKPSYLSKVVYVELADAKGNVVEKRMLPLTKGKARGEIYIKPEQAGGTYAINAYTLWMLNFPQFLFSRPVQIFNTSSIERTPTITNDFAFQFFPEGGQLVAGVSNRIAFKALLSNGMPVEVSGDIYDDQKNKIQSFTSVHDGMGRFAFEPKAGVSYSAVVKTKNGLEKTVALPAASGQGVAIQVSNENMNRMFVHLQVNPADAARVAEVHVVGQINGDAVFTSRLPLQDGEVTFPVSKKDLPAGIMHITVFSSQGAPIAERLAFVSNYELKQEGLSATKEDHQPRRKNEFLLDLAGYRNLSPSVAVVNAAMDSSMAESGMLASVLLSSELPGVIYNSSFYFKDKSPATLEALDLLLMTQGWRRFQWTDLLADKFPVLKFPVESGITVSGSLTKVDGLSQIANGRVDFITKTEDSLTILTTVNLTKENAFFIPDLNFKKEATIYIQGTNKDKQKSLTKVVLNEGVYDTLKKSMAALRPDTVQVVAMPAGLAKLINQKRIEEQTLGKVMQNITVRARRLSPADSLTKLYATDIFQMSDQTIVMDKRPYHSIWQFMERHVNGLTIGRNEFGQTTVNFSRYMGLATFSDDEVSDPTTNIRFFLNEIQVAKDIVETLDPNDIALVKVWKGASAGILGASSGAIGIYTDKSVGARDWRSRPFLAFKKQGYSVSREFFHMDYAAFTPENGFSDVRGTLYWNPDLKIDSNGKAAIEFYNDDVTKSYRIVVNGIDENGKLLYIEKIFK
jgi:hypothetical protein